MNAVVFKDYETTMKKQEARVLVIGDKHADSTILKLLALQQNITKNLTEIESKEEIAKRDAAPDTIIILGEDGKEEKRFKPEATEEEVGKWIVLWVADHLKPKLQPLPK